MRVVGAVLEQCGRPGPYATTRPLTVGELDLDPPGPGELLVHLEVAGVCHSDLSVVDGTRARPTPMLLGHEAAGLVAGLGAGVDDLALGQRVVTTFLPRCGRCPECATDGALPCRAGSAANTAGHLLGGGVRLHRDGQPVAHHLGVSAFAEAAVVARASVVPVPDDVPAGVAALLGCAVLTGGGAVVNAGRPRPGEPVAVVGLGGVGLAAAAVAAALGHPVLGVDAAPAKLALAASALDGVGPGATLLTGDDAVAQGLSAPVVVEAAGAPAALETALALTAPGGRCVTVGLPAPDAVARIRPLDLVAGARTLTGCYLGSSVPARDVPRYVQLWRAGALPLERLVTGTLPLAEANRALDDLAGGTVLRQLLDVGAAR